MQYFQKINALKVKIERIVLDGKATSRATGRHLL